MISPRHPSTAANPDLSGIGVLEARGQPAARERFENLPDDPDRIADLFDPDPGPGMNIPGNKDRDGDLDPVIGRKRVMDPAIEVQAACPRHKTDHAQVAGLLGTRVCRCPSPGPQQMSFRHR